MPAPVPSFPRTPSDRADAGLDLHRESPAERKLRAYFFSGWIFLIPYLGIYLLSAWQGWSVTAVVRTFQALHLFHLAGVGWVWLRVGSKARRQGRRAWARLGWSLAPWGLLALLVHLPGTYLEMPADPWAHFSRVNEWARFASPLANPEWKKSGSLLVYSVVAPWDSAALKAGVFGTCATGFSLLYYWQYFLLARTCGLSRRMAWCGVLANLFLFGNNIFGFHRYYGMATTVIAQIGVLALSRHVIACLKPTMQSARAGPGKSLARWAGQLALGGALLLLIAFNHVQGLALAAMALAGILGWRLVHRKPARLYWLGAAYLVVNLLAAWLRPKHPDAAAMYQTSGWLNAWFGFDLLNWHSPSFERARQILGLLGMVNLVSGLLLVFRRPLVAWLTVLPVVTLLSPACGIIFANAVARFGPAGYEYIPSFNRLLLGIPSGLAVCCLLSDLSKYFAFRCQSPARLQGQTAFAAVPLVLLLFTTLPPSGPYFNRLWHTFMRVPNDLRMAHVAATADVDLVKNHRERGTSRSFTTPSFHVLATPGTGFVLAAFGDTSVPFRNKWMLYPVLSTPVNRINSVQLALKPLIQQSQPSVLVVPAPAALTSPASQAGFLSGHWLPSQVALEQAGAAELEEEIAPYYSLRRDIAHVRIFGPR